MKKADKDQLLQALGRCQRGDSAKIDSFEDENHTKWNFITVYYVNTLDYDPKKNTCYDKGLEIMHTDLIPLCAHINTEIFFHEVVCEDTAEYMAEECQLDKIEPGYYKCVCGVKIDDTTSTSWEGVTEYDTETYYYLLSRTKMSPGDVDYLIEEQKVYPTKEEYAEIVASTV